MRALYNKITSLLCKVDFNAIWDGFHIYPFALYNKTTVYLSNKEIPYDNRFVGNTAIQYDGEYIAIWLIGDNEVNDAETLAANMVHEMFHAYQLENDESRFPDELFGLDYPMTSENLIIRAAESSYISDAILSTNAVEKLRLIENAVALRKQRMDIFGDVLNYEFGIETIEGAAEYCGTRALCYISPSKYRERLISYAAALKDSTNIMRNTRHCFYLMGSMLLLLRDELGLSYSKLISSDNTVYFNESLIFSTPTVSVPVIETDTSQLNSLLSDMASTKQMRFDEFYSTPTIEKSGDYRLCGYDPMNITKSGNKLLHSHFVILKETGSNESQFINGPVVTHFSGSPYDVTSFETH